MKRFRIRIYDVDEVTINALRSDEEAEFDFDELFQTNYMMNRNKKDVDILELSCDEIHTEGSEIYFSIINPEAQSIDSVFISHCDYSYLEII